MRINDSIAHFLVLLLIIFLSSCSTMDITYDSIPSGAQVIDSSGTIRGYAPVTFQIEPTMEDKERGYAYTWDIVMKWVSGASVKVSAGKVAVGKNWIYTTNRPSNEPNAHIDHQFALQLQQQRILEAQQKQEAWDKINRSLKNTAEEIRRNTPKTTHTNCYKTFGNTVNCTSTTY